MIGASAAWIRHSVFPLFRCCFRRHRRYRFNIQKGIIFNVIMTHTQIRADAMHVVACKTVSNADNSHGKNSNSNTIRIFDRIHQCWNASIYTGMNTFKNPYEICFRNEKNWDPLFDSYERRMMQFVDHNSFDFFIMFQPCDKI